MRLAIAKPQCWCGEVMRGSGYARGARVTRGGTEEPDTVGL